MFALFNLTLFTLHTAKGESKINKDKGLPSHLHFINLIQALAKIILIAL